MTETDDREPSRSDLAYDHWLDQHDEQAAKYSAWCREHEMDPESVESAIAYEGDDFWQTDPAA